MAEREKSKSEAAERQSPAGENPPRRPAAQSLDREPTDEPTPEGNGEPVDKEDEPKGHPTSDRFQTEQAHLDAEEDEAKGS